MSTTIAVLGPGAVGGALAVRLALAGRRVVCVARAETASSIARDGLTLVQGEETLHVFPEAVERLPEPADVLVIAVKAPDLDDAVERVDAEPAVAVPMLNGIEHMDAIRARLPRVVAGSISRFEGYRTSRTRIVQRTPSLVVTLASPEPADHLRAAGIDVRVTSSEKDLLWEKLTRLAPLAALTASTQLPVGGVRSDPRLEAALEEACAVAAADGADVSPDEQWAIIGQMRDDLTTSAARDVAAGRRSELDAIVGAVVRAGTRLGVPTPTLEELLVACPA